MAFTLNLKSVDGYFQGYSINPSPLSDATNNVAPSYSSSTFPIYQYQDDGNQESIQKWVSYYSPSANKYGVLESAYDFVNYLLDYQTETGNSEMVVCAFDIVDGNGTKTGAQLCLMANGTVSGNINFQLKKRVYSQGAYVYTNISNSFTYNYSGILSFGMIAGIVTESGVQYYSFGFCAHMNNGYRAQATLFGNTSRGLTEIMGGTIPEEETDPAFGPGSEPGGYDYDGTPGTFDDSSDIIGIDPKPDVGVTTMGFVNVYKITQNQLQTLGEKLFPHFLPAEILADPSQLTTPEVLTMFIKSMFGSLISPAGTTVYLADNLGVIDILMNGKLIDYVIDCHAIPCSISDATVEGLKVGYRQFNDLQVARATEDYVDVDCGELSIGEYFKNFLDFGTVSCDLFLPFIGFVPIESEYWNGGTLKVVYRINIVDGSFQAKVLSTSSKSKLTETLIGQYGGVACVHYPITGLQYSNVVSGLVNGSINAIEKGSSGNIGGVATSLANMSMLRPDNPMSNGYNASSGFLSHRTPYLVIKRPAPQFSTQYPKEMGLPLNVTMTLSNVHGFTVIDNPILNIQCSDDEYNEIVSYLKSGVIL